MKLIKTPLGIFNLRKYRLWHSKTLIPIILSILLLAIAYDLGRLREAKRAVKIINEITEAITPTKSPTATPRSVLNHPDAIRVTTPGFDAYCIEVKNLRVSGL